MFKFISHRMFQERNLNQYDEHLIQMQGVFKAYETEAGEFLALKNVKLVVNKGEFVGVIGKSGSGKSTLINMITGIDRPTKGEINIGGTPIHAFNEGQMAKWRGRNLGIVFQFFQLLPMLTVLENIMLPMDFCKLYKPSQRRKRALHLLDLVGVADQEKKLPSMLSGGQQQRVAIARALANDPPIIVADEPTGNLDSKTAASVFNLFEELVAGGKTILTVTHDSDQAKRLHRTIIIADGEIIEEYLADTFPLLTQQQLVWITSRLEPQTFPPSSVIIRQGEPPDRFYIITKGRAEVLLKAANGQEFVVKQLERGQYFGEIALLHGGMSTATVRAATDCDVELATLDGNTFTQLMTDSESTKTEIQLVAKKRQRESMNRRREIDNA
jgi:ABC-type lipoprotein export system ATPase subunit